MLCAASTQDLWQRLNLNIIRYRSDAKGILLKLKYGWNFYVLHTSKCLQTSTVGAQTTDCEGHKVSVFVFYFSFRWGVFSFKRWKRLTYIIIIPFIASYALNSFSFYFPYKWTITSFDMRRCIMLEKTSLLKHRTGESLDHIDILTSYSLVKQNTVL